jgi:hypothetical protein
LWGNKLIWRQCRHQPLNHLEEEKEAEALSTVLQWGKLVFGEEWPLIFLIPLTIKISNPERANILWAAFKERLPHQNNPEESLVLASVDERFLQQLDGGTLLRLALVHLLDQGCR